MMNSLVSNNVTGVYLFKELLSTMTCLAVVFGDFALKDAARCARPVEVNEKNNQS